LAKPLKMDNVVFVLTINLIKEGIRKELSIMSQMLLESNIHCFSEMVTIKHLVQMEDTGKLLQTIKHLPQGDSPK